MSFPPGPAEGERRTSAWEVFSKSPAAIAGALIAALLIVVGLTGPWLAPYDPPSLTCSATNSRPALAHWFGVDALGRDIFSRILMGARISLAAGFVSVAIGACSATILGLLAGYFGGWWDRVIMRICDVLFAFPGILLAMAWWRSSAAA